MTKQETQFFTFADEPGKPFSLQNGQTLGPITLAYETYGKLNEAKDNAILLFHALSGSQHAAGYNESIPGVGPRWTDECRKGWWDKFIGPDKALDTRHFFVICVNYIGGCYGSTGPSSINPATGKPYGGSFPSIRANDIVDTQMILLDHFGINALHAVVGSSFGGMLAANLSIRYPERVSRIILIACGIDVTILQRIHNFEQILAIEENAHFNAGDYYEGAAPDKGLALARMISHKTFVSLQAMQHRARTEIIRTGNEAKPYHINHPVESYLLHQGHKFVQRFDANTYLRIIEAWQHFNLEKDAGDEALPTLLRRCQKQRFLVFSIDSDVCFYTDEQEHLVQLLQGAGAACQHITVHSDKGHDAFLLEPKLFTPHFVYMLKDKC